MVYNKQTLYLWHVNRFIFPNEKLTDDQKKPVGDFHFYQGKWILINRRLPELWDKDTDTKIEVGNFVELTEGKKILLGKNDGDRLIIVQLVNN
jgi:hypothetical protein